MTVPPNLKALQKEDVFHICLRVLHSAAASNSENLTVVSSLFPKSSEAAQRRLPLCSARYARV